MVPGCCGCVENFVFAVWAQDADGLHLVQEELTNLGSRGHFRALLVDDRGRIIIW